MYKLAICDDSPADTVYLQGLVSKWARKADKMIEIQTFISAEAFLFEYEEDKSFDILLLDIEMDNGSGIKVGKYIRSELQDDSTQIVFVSGKTEYDRQLFEFHPLGFIEKPVFYDRLSQMLNKYIKIYGDFSEIFFYKSDHNNHWIKMKDIMYFESQDRKIIIMDSDKNVREFYGKMDNVYEQVRSKGFMMIHKSYIINYRYVCEFHSNEIIMSDDRALPISKHRKKDVMKWQLAMERGGRSTND